MYDKTKLIFERNPVYIIHIGTNDTTKSTPNKIIDNILAWKTFIVNVNKNCKVIILAMRCDSKRSVYAVDKVSSMLKELNVPFFNSVNTVKKHVGIKGLHLNQYGEARQVMNYIAAINKLSQDVGYLKRYIKQKSFDSTENIIFENPRKISEEIEETLLMF